MSYYPLPLQANKPYRIDVSGKLLLIDDLGAATGVDVTLVRNGTESKTMPARKKAFKLVAEYDAVILQTTVDATVSLFLSYDDVSLGFAEGVAVSVPGGVNVTNLDAAPVPVKTPAGVPLEVNFAGTVAPVLGNVTVTNNDAEAIPSRPQALTTFTNAAPVSVGVAATSIGLADATNRKIIIRNTHATAKIGLGGAGVTLANAAIILLPGDIWDEKDAAGAEWFAISDTPATDVAVMRVK